MTHVAAPFVTAPETRAVMEMLAGTGTPGWFVGGCVRNALLGVAVADVDIATAARPEAVIAAAEAAGLKAVPTGIDHGTVTVVSGGVPFEITTFRKDIETDGRHARVVFSAHMEDDAARRDFTMNALYADAGGRVVDPVGGLPDLAARRLRFIGVAEDRIVEDYLRILRFFRFHAIYGDPGAGIDAEGLAACAAHIDGLGQLSKERVGAEMKKLLAARDPAPAVAAMQACGALGMVLPGASAAPIAVLVHLEEAAPPDAIRRLAALGGEEPSGNLRLSRAEAKRLDAIRNAALGGMGPMEMGYRLGAGAGYDALLVQSALTSTPVGDEARAAVEFGAAQQFPVKAADLTPALEGPDLGAALKSLEKQWIASEFALGKAELIGKLSL